MFIDDETGGRHKLDNPPKDRATLSTIRPLGGLSFDMVVKRGCSGCTVYSSHGKGETARIQ